MQFPLFFSGSKYLFPSSSMKAVVKTCTCVISLFHLDFIFQFFEKAVRNLSLLNSLDHLDCSLAVFDKEILFQEANFYINQ